MPVNRSVRLPVGALLDGRFFPARLIRNSPAEI